MMTYEELRMGFRFWKRVSLFTIATLFLLFGFLGFVTKYGNPLPWPDKGYRHYWVKDANAAAAAVEISNLGGVLLRSVKKIGDTHQAWMWDGTVYLWMDNTPAMNGWPGNGPSLVVDVPKEAASEALKILERYGFHDGLTMELPGTQKPGQLFLVKSQEAFKGWCFPFRLFGPKMGMPPDDAPLPFLQ
jgi:hypothetical protein